MAFNMTENQKKRVRFSVEDDMILLREVLAANPFEDVMRWIGIQEVIFEKTGKKFTLRALKEHLELILKKFGGKDDKNKKKTGTEESYNEYDHLLQKIRDMSRDFFGNAKNNPKQQSVISSNKLYEKDCIEKGNMLRESYLQQFRNEYIAVASTSEVDENQVESHKPLQDISVEVEMDVLPSPVSSKSVLIATKATQPNKTVMPNISTPHRQRQSKRLRNSALDFLGTKQEKENLLRTKELELEARKLDIEEKTLKLEEKRLAHEIEFSKKKLELEAIKVKIEQADKKKIT